LFPPLNAMAVVATQVLLVHRQHHCQIRQQTPGC